ncbi:hypothetical protein [Thiomicrorhabdus arctica]|uniref:hypothetical protein n=1 Tax=Thiomicrorhabdus arctica TaxID=131540 RepID=UPI001B7FE0BA|nr:hypothetical protein [Thiomicrorhabdus arctica]
MESLNMITANIEIYFDTKESIERIRNFNVQRLPRDTELCDQLNFHDPAQKLIELYKRLSAVSLRDLPDDVLMTIQNNANCNYQIFQQILNFDFEQNNPGEARIMLLNQISAAYQSTFNALQQYIPNVLYRRSTDFQALKSDTRRMLQSAEITEQEYKALLEY